MLSSVLDSEEDINVLTDRLIRKIQGCIASTFKKVRTTKNKKSKLDSLYEKLSDLKEDESISDNMKVNYVVEEIARKYNRIFGKLANTKHQDKINQQSFWKLKKDICPKSTNPPSVMLDRCGNIITSDKAIRARAVEVYQERLKGNKIKKHLKEREDEINQLCE